MKWISVKERMPQPNQDAIFLVTNGRWTCRYATYHRFNPDASSAVVNRFYCHCNWKKTCFLERESSDVVTHWIEIPDLPKPDCSSTGHTVKAVCSVCNDIVYSQTAYSKDPHAR